MTSHKLWLLFIIYVYSATCELHRKVIFPLLYGLHVYLYIKEGGREGGKGGGGAQELGVRVSIRIEYRLCRDSLGPVSMS